MRIESFTIKNYRSIKELKIDNLMSINVFFGKNNVGKSNILRALHLAFYCLRTPQIFLPETMFFNRTIYEPIEVIMDLDLENGFRDPEHVTAVLRDAIENTHSVPAIKDETSTELVDEIERFVEASYSFSPLRKVTLKVRIGYSEETSDVGVSVESPEIDYNFDYGAYRTAYGTLAKLIMRKRFAEVERIIRSISIELSRMGIDVDDIHPYFRRPRGYTLEPEEIDRLLSRLERHVSRIEELEKREYALVLLDRYRDKLRQPKRDLVEPFSNVFNIVKEYYERISDNFILIPNKEYFLRGPFHEQDGERIQMFNMDGFLDRLLSFIEAPNTKGRELIEKFYSVFNESYSDLGKLKSIAKLKDQVFVIFGTSVTSLPVEEQGLGIQDLFLYLANMILFDPAIVAIEEPEGGLSTENQSHLRKIIERVYSKIDKQILISSHSDEFETPNSYIIEMSRDGTKEIGRMEKREDYEEKIEKILIRRKLVEEKTQLELLLREVTQRQMTLDVLNYINGLTDEQQIDVQEIADKLGYQKEKVQEILKQSARKK